MRLFCAIKPEPGFLKALTDLQNGMRSAGVRGNYSKTANLHITLAFIGEYNDPAKALEAVRSVRFEPFEIKLSKTGSFPGVYFAGIDECIELNRCAADLRAALAGSDIPYDRKKFSPHITLIRQPDKPLPPLTVPAAKMTVSRISLMRSDRGPNGLVYTEIK